MSLSAALTSAGYTHTCVSLQPALQIGVDGAVDEEVDAVFDTSSLGAGLALQNDDRQVPLAWLLAARAVVCSSFISPSRSLCPLSWRTSSSYSMLRHSSVALTTLKSSCHHVPCGRHTHCIVPPPPTHIHTVVCMYDARCVVTQPASCLPGAAWGSPVARLCSCSRSLVTRTHGSAWVCLRREGEETTGRPTTGGF